MTLKLFMIPPYFYIINKINYTRIVLVTYTYVTKKKKILLDCYEKYLS